MSNNNDLRVFEYKGKTITFRSESGDKFVSATQMVQAYDKRLNDFFRLKQTAEYVKELYLSIEGEDAELPEIKSRVNTDILAKAYPSLIKTIKGGTPELQGTWVHERLSLKLAAWLSPKFEVWVYDTIMHLMKNDSIIFTGKEKTTYEWFLTKISYNINELTVLFNDLPGQLPRNRNHVRQEEE